MKLPPQLLIFIIIFIICRHHLLLLLLLITNHWIILIPRTTTTTTLLPQTYNLSPPFLLLLNPTSILCGASTIFGLYRCSMLITSPCFLIFYLLSIYILYLYTHSSIYIYIYTHRVIYYIIISLSNSTFYSSPFISIVLPFIRIYIIL